MDPWLNNHQAIAKRGGVVGGDDDFVVVACGTCGRQYLYNEETLDFYVDPDDLSRRVVSTDDLHLACLGCGTKDFEERLLDPESPELQRGPWAWAR